MAISGPVERLLAGRNRQTILALAVLGLGRFDLTGRDLREVEVAGLELQESGLFSP